MSVERFLQVRKDKIKLCFEYLWPRLKTQALAKQLWRQGRLDGKKYLSIKKLRKARFWYTNLIALLVFVPIGLWLFVALLHSVYYYPDYFYLHIKLLVLLLFYSFFIYLVLRRDFEDEWTYVRVFTLGIRTKGKVLSVVVKPISTIFQYYFEDQAGRAVHAQMYMVNSLANKLLVEPGDTVNLVYDPDNSGVSFLVTDTTEAFNILKY